ncbi:oligoendopeptidase, M3 family [Isosphaera pallida ATCC 43644]|uniref:Oligoendopeptidase, M3 family n=1 Tax=Isosphaera pallida (strain ATCC 43644 / DSM 9630 / IS1B) TaxID=575540 RepID=E8R3Q4_ISOPI|nr:M3 family oligoendopeptidase [Isosphaera pallida]ADV62639.1 oligoendopeptidase, M3 family [Isosphaera pallida ATCC 43644]
MSVTTYQPEPIPRRRLNDQTRLTTWAEIEPWYRELVERPISSARDLEEWLADFDELQSAVGQERERRHIAMTCQTDDPAREAAYLEFLRDVDPHVKSVVNTLRSKYLDCPFRAELPPETTAPLTRLWANRRDLFREANIPRETELAELGQSYQKIIGAMTVTFQGEERTLAAMAKFQEETDRAVREQAWRLTTQRRLQDKETLDDLFDKMIRLRVEIAREAGFADYVAYAYRDRERFDYDRSAAADFQKAVETEVVPLARQLREQRRQRLGVERLRPWDLAVDPLGRPPLRPFDDAQRLATGCQAVFNAIDPELGARFEYLRTHDLLDLANRKGKAPGGYQTTLEFQRLPFIFMNAVGVDDDVRTLLHEGGHAFHTLEARHLPYGPLREAPIEFCEVASMTMELFGANDLAPFYQPDQAARSHRQLLEGIVTILPWIATVDAFQHWVYDHPDHDRAQRRAAWSDLMDRFNTGVDWSDLDEAKAHTWHRQLHIFLYPFYYIEYGLAQIGALEIWKRSLDDRAGAVAAYRRALALGGTRPLPELFHAAGARFDFSPRTIGPLMATIQDELAKLPE